jgi:ABC-type Fe3+ transport system substrate-binding protein
MRQGRGAGWMRALGGVLAAGLLLGACASGGAGPAPAAAPSGSSGASAPGGAGASGPRSVAQVASLSGPDRQATLEAGARQEGQLLWYTTLIVNQAVRPLIDGFTKKYPYVKVDHYRANSGDLTQRMTNEYQAKRYDVDIIDGTSTVPLMKEAGWVEKFNSPATAPYPAEYKDPQGYWATSNLYFMTEGINTQMVSKADAPKTYEDLLDPRWKGKMGWSTSSGSGGPTFVGSVLQTMGQDKGMAYLEQLSRQDVKNLNISARAVLDQVIAGEYPIALMIFNHHTVISAQQGAPSDWVPLQPVPALLQIAGLASNAPHPHAAMLFLDYIFSEEGQHILQEADYLPAHPGVPAKVPSLKPEVGGFKTNVMSPDDLMKHDQEWDDVYHRLFLRQ